MKNYYSVCVRGISTKKERVQGCHIIKALNTKDALRIREKFGISNPRYVIGDLQITCRKIDNTSHDDVEIMLTRRRQGIGGHIWYEDKEGNLQTETV